MILVLDSRDPLVIHEHSVLEEFHLNCPPTVFGLALLENLIDLHIVIVIFVGLVRMFQDTVKFSCVMGCGSR